MALSTIVAAASAPRTLEAESAPMPLLQESDADAIVITEGVADPILDGPPAPENARYVDPQNPSSIAYYGTEAGYRFLAPLRSAAPDP